MSRAYDARKKARRHQADVLSPSPQVRRPPVVAVLFLLFILGFAFATVQVLRGGASGHQSYEEVPEDVSALLAGIPQHGASLGSPRAPVTLRIYADLECHTVRRFVFDDLPSIIEAWVRPGLIRLEYRSLQTDTRNESTFTRQETATLAAGKQDRLWVFVEIFVHEQGREYTEYATDRFLHGIAAQVPGIDVAQWNRARRSGAFLQEVLLSDHHAREEGLRGTPSFLLGRTGGAIGHRVGPEREGARLLTTRSLKTELKALSEATGGAIPTYGFLKAIKEKD